MTTATAEKQTTALVAPTANVGRELSFGNWDREQVELLSDRRQALRDGLRLIPPIPGRHVDQASAAALRAMTHDVTPRVRRRRQAP